MSDTGPADEAGEIVEAIERAIADLLDRLQGEVAASPAAMALALERSTERATQVGLAPFGGPALARRRAIAWMANEAIGFLVFPAIDPAPDQ